MEKQAHERAAAEEQERKKAEAELRERILEEAMVKLEAKASSHHQRA